MPLPASPRRRLRAAGTVVVAAAAALTLASCTATGSLDSKSTMPSSSTPQAVSTVTGAPLESAQDTAKVPVYWLGRSQDNVFLYREFLASNSTGDPILSALETMTSGQPLDPDYYTPWHKPSKLGASISGNNLITVDISSDAFSKGVDAGVAERAVQQLVYTVTAAAANAGLTGADGNLQVSILVDGHTDYRAFGQVNLDHPLARSGAFLAPVWIIDPQQGATGKGSMAVRGAAAAPDGTVHWQLLKTSGSALPTNYLDGSAPVSARRGQLGSFSFKLSPPPGSYELRVWEVRATDPTVQYGIDTKTFDIK